MSDCDALDSLVFFSEADVSPGLLVFIPDDGPTVFAIVVVEVALRDAVLTLVGKTTLLRAPDVASAFVLTPEDVVVLVAVIVDVVLVEFAFGPATETRRSSCASQRLVTRSFSS